MRLPSGWSGNETTQTSALFLTVRIPWVFTEEVGHCMLPYIRDQILELVNESLLVAVL